MVNLEFYKNKRVFVTGHTGFKGSWLLMLLEYLGADVMGYALKPNTKPNLFSLIDGNNRCTSVIGDIRDASFLQAQILSFKPDIIFHLAAQPLVKESYLNPAETFEVNVMGTVNVLYGIKLLEKPCLGVMITTDKVYQNNESGQAYKEEDRIGGYDPYSSSKACAELVIDSFRKSFFNPKEYEKHGKSIASARAGNVIGGGDWATDRLIPDIARAFSKEVAVQIRNPHAVRPWQHVLEPLTGYLVLGATMAQNPEKYADAFNFGPYPEDVLTVKEMAEMAVKIWKNNKIEFPTLENQPHEAGLLSLSIDKANKELNWYPRWNAQEALQHTIEWYKTFYTNELEAFLLLKKQINTYFNIHQ